jgi:hypothetical protein
VRVPGVFYESVDCNGHVSQAGELRLRFFYSDAGGILTARWRGSGTASFCKGARENGVTSKGFFNCTNVSPKARLISSTLTMD